MEVVCINNRNRPNELPANKWVKENEIYTVIEVCRLNVQDGILGFKLAEINIDEFTPLEYFRADRFAPVGDITELEEFIQEKLEA